jgi:pimeloyl-ACP methyl ester carboxylesterase
VTRLATVAAACVCAAACFPPEWGANAIVRPFRRPLAGTPPLPHEAFAVESDGLTLRGWLFRRSGARKGLIVYLHGIGDNRRGGAALAERFVPKGWDVLAYDARGHGESGGDFCTYGVKEKRDLVRALDAAGSPRVVLFGSSLGGAVALQAAPLDPRIRGVIAEAPFSSLDTVVRDRAPWFASKREVDEALRLAGERAGFAAGDASPERAARHVTAPVLLIHGAEDDETPPAHSQRIESALAGPKRLILVEGATHRDALAGAATWREIESWLAGLPD